MPYTVIHRFTVSTAARRGLSCSAVRATPVLLAWILPARCARQPKFAEKHNRMNSTIANKCAWHGYRAIFSRKSIVIARVSARVSHLHAALKKQPLTLVLTAPDEYRLQFLTRYAIIIVSSSTVTYICITEECASDKCAEIAAFFSRRCSICSRTTKMSRTCGTTGKSKHPFLFYQLYQRSWWRDFSISPSFFLSRTECKVHHAKLP